MPLSLRSRALVGGIAAAVLAAPFALLAPAAGAAGECTNFQAVASAEGVRVGYDSPGFIVIEKLAVGLPVAQASLDAFGGSTGYAAYPDPSDEILSLLPALGVSRDIYPLIAVSQYPFPNESRFTSPAVNLLATSHEREARAIADSGLGAAGLVNAVGLLRASSTATCSDIGTVTALAETTLDGLTLLDGVVRIPRIHSLAKVTVSPSGERKVESDLNVGVLSVAGIDFGLTDKGLVLAGTAIPLPDLGLDDLFRDLGIGITYLDAEVQPDGRGVTAAGVQIAISQSISGGAPTVITLTIGRAFALADSTPGGGTSSPPPTSNTPVVGGDGTTIALPSSPAGPDLSPPAVRTPEPVDRARPISAIGPFSAWGIYAVLVGGAIAVLSSGLVFKRLGVRLGWR